MTLRISAATDIGLRREHNEDAMAVWSSNDPVERALRGDLVIVADGMGGTAAGEVASRLAVENVLRTFQAEPAGGDHVLTHAIEAAHAAIRRLSLDSASHSGMGTTCTVIAVRGREVRYAHVGDSRAYRVHLGEIRRITQDHSLVAQLVEQRLMTAEQARVDPRRNVLTRSVGVGEEIDVDEGVEAEPLQVGETLLLCSDGLHGVVTDEELAQHGSASDFDRGCSDLIALARARGGPDNITVVLARYDGD